MIKSLLLLGAGLAFATSTFAGGMELSAVSCPGEPGAVGATVVYPHCFPPGGPCPPNPDWYGGVELNCASGDDIDVIATWSPNEDIPDLLGVDALMDVFLPDGIDASPFWNYFDASNGCMTSTLRADHVRPLSCAAPVSYTGTWTAGGISAVAGARRSPNTGRIAFACARATPLAVSANEKLFGVRITFEGSSAAEAGGSCQGCCHEIGLVLYEVTPATGGSPATSIYNPSGQFPGFMNAMRFTGSAVSCKPVKTVARSWGQMKALYR